MHRCMYKKLIIQFKQLKLIVRSAVFKSILSFDDLQYIRKTYDKKILKWQFLCQEVSNKFKVQN